MVQTKQRNLRPFYKLVLRTIVIVIVIATIVAVIRIACDPCIDASAICNDGTCSHSEHRQGTCSGHGGVKTWLKDLP